MSERVVSVNVYVRVLAALLVLLGATVAVGLVEGPGLGLTSSLAIATTKALLIVLFFMHVRHGTPIVRLAAGAGFLWLAFLVGLSLTDLMTRDWTPATEVSASQGTGRSREPGP